MATRIRAVDIPRALHVDDYRDVDGATAAVDACAHLGRRVGRLLGTGRVFMLSSTARGGGVAEMMPRVCTLLDDVGVDARWLVLETDEPGFFDTTKRLHNLLHGRDDGGSLDADVYDRVSRAAAAALRRVLEPGDVLVVHDPQPVGAGALVAPLLDGALVWRCHVGVPFADDATRAAWTFLAPRLAPYARSLFSSERYVPDFLVPRGGVIHPSIDPRDHKNRDLRPAKLLGVLASCGLLAAPPRPPWTAFARKASWLRPEGWTNGPIPDFLYAPLVLQVSRFDRLKGFPVVLDAFARLARDGPAWARAERVRTERALDEIARAELVLAGPDPGGVADDPEAVSVLADLEHAWLRLPAELAPRVRVVKLPMDDPKQNALMVNALQRAASVVVQASLQEGFGLTVTEAMWKGTPVVATDVGGISLQLRAGVDGLLVPAGDPAALARAMFEQLVVPARAEAMGAAARRRVAEHFLVVRQVRRWLEELAGVVDRRGAGAHPPAP